MSKELTIENITKIVKSESDKNRRLLLAFLKAGFTGKFSKHLTDPCPSSTRVDPGDFRNARPTAGACEPDVLRVSIVERSEGQCILTTPIGGLHILKSEQRVFALRSEANTPDITVTVVLDDPADYDAVFELKPPLDANNQFTLEAGIPRCFVVREVMGGITKTTPPFADPTDRQHARRLQFTFHEPNNNLGRCGGGDDSDVHIEC